MLEPLPNDLGASYSPTEIIAKQKKFYLENNRREKVGLPLLKYEN